jgi:hypothetical protein
MRILLIIFANLLLLTSCESKKEPEVEKGVIDLSELWDTEDVIKLSEIAESIEYLSLETNENCILNNASSLRAVKAGNRIFIYSRESNIKVFDDSGKYLFDLGSYGQGPEEYINIQLKADSSTKLVWILDSRQHKILKFDFTGKFLESFRVEDDIVKFSLLDDYKVALLNMPYPGEKKKAISILIKDFSGNNNDEVFLDSLPEYQGGSQPRASSFFSILNNKLHVSISPFRYILELNNSNTWDTIWHIHHGENTAADELYNGPYQTLLDNTHMRYISELPGHILMNGLYKRTNRYFIYDKKTKTTRINHLVAETTNRGDLVGFINDLDGGLPFWPSGSAGDNTYLKLFNAQRFIDMANGDIQYYYSEQVTPLSGKLFEFCKTLNEEDNPVVMIVKFK